MLFATKFISKLVGLKCITLKNICREKYVGLQCPTMRVEPTTPLCWALLRKL